LAALQNYHFVGYESQVYNEVYLELGKPLILDAQLNDVSQQLTEVKVTGSKNKVFGKKNRCRNYYWKERITSLPTISRSADDFTRLEPSASGGSLWS
jgi:hypothetical protein